MGTNSVVLDGELLVQVCGERWIGVVSGLPFGEVFIFHPDMVMWIEVESTLGLLPLAQNEDKVRELLKSKV